MKLRTQITIPTFDHLIDYSSHIFTIGSCFAQQMGEAMERVKLRSTTNPTGTLFNPISISQTIERIATKRHITTDELRSGDSGFYHYDFHSSLNAPTAEQTLCRINSAINHSSIALESADWVIITLGSAWIYELATEQRGHTVANCHKEPARNFTRRRVGVEEIVATLGSTITKHLASKNIILTLSPIRHVADGLAENSLSKATLRLAIEEIVATHPNVIYFPTYEVLIDDLRDYRFYASDMVHPSTTAIEYIWELFCDAALTPQTRHLLPQVLDVIHAAEHRPKNPTSEAHKKLCHNQLTKIKSLEMVDLSKEYTYFDEQLKINL